MDPVASEPVQAMPLPPMNVVGEFGSDQALGSVLGITPWAWGWIALGVALLGVLAAWRFPTRTRELPDLEPRQWLQGRVATVLAAGLFWGGIVLDALLVIPAGMSIWRTVRLMDGGVAVRAV